MATATTKSDSQIKDDVLAELKWDPRVDDTEVGVQVHEGIVTLTGNITAYAKKLAARDAAHRVHGVLDVVDELRVKFPNALERTDEDVVRAVRSALKWDVLVPDDRITTTVCTGTVTLQGTVDTWSQRMDAEHAVHRLAGVSAVVNEIQIAGKPCNGAQVKHLIEGALERQAEREARRLSVAVKDGVVTLTGTVRSFAERVAVERAAGFAPGVSRVENLTTVDPYR